MRVLMVIPGSADDQASMVFARRQSAAVESAGGTVAFFFLASRTDPRAVMREVSRLRQVVADVRPDVVHAHFGTVTGMVCVTAGCRPLVVSFRGSDINPLYHSFRRNLGDHWLRNTLGRAMSRRAAHRAEGIVCVSEQLRQRLPASTRGRAIVVPSGVDLERFTPASREAARAALGWSTTDRVVLFNAGRFSALKRPELAQAAVEWARRELPDIKLVTLDGTASPSSIPQIINASDVVLLTSDYEGSPNIVKEAIACSVPVVSTPAGDVPERLADVRPSWLTDGSVAALGRGIVEAITFGGRTNGAEIARRDLDGRIGAQKLLAFYHDVVRRTTAPHAR